MAVIKRIMVELKQEVVGGTELVTVTPQGFANDLDLLAGLHKALGWFINLKAHEVAEAQRKAARQGKPGGILGADGKPVVQ